jgi:hypothetical protein
MALGDAIDPPRLGQRRARAVHLPVAHDIRPERHAVFPQNYVRPGLPTRGRLSRATQERKGLRPRYPIKNVAAHALRIHR